MFTCFERDLRRVGLLTAHGRVRGGVAGEVAQVGRGSASVRLCAGHKGGHCERSQHGEVHVVWWESDVGSGDLKCCGKREWLLGIGIHC
jgi:hypothetical protein